MDEHTNCFVPGCKSSFTYGNTDAKAGAKLVWDAHIDDEADEEQEPDSPLVWDSD
jgi:hypothetical protein